MYIYTNCVFFSLLLLSNSLSIFFSIILHSFILLGLNCRLSITLDRSARRWVHDNNRPTVLDIFRGLVLYIDSPFIVLHTERIYIPPKKKEKEKKKLNEKRGYTNRGNKSWLIALEQTKRYQINRLDLSIQQSAVSIDTFLSDSMAAILFPCQFQPSRANKSRPYNQV